MTNYPEQQLRWVGISDDIQRIYRFPSSLPWHEEIPEPGLGDRFINLGALRVGLELFLDNAEDPDDNLKTIFDFCGIVEMAEGQMEQYEYQAALETLAEAEEKHKCPFIHWQRCLCYIELKMTEQALGACHHAAQGAGVCGVFWRVLGELWEAEGQDAEAAKAFQLAFSHGEAGPSVLRAMTQAGELARLPNNRETLVLPHVARCVLRGHVFSAINKERAESRLCSLVDIGLEITGAEDDCIALGEALVQRGREDGQISKRDATLCLLRALAKAPAKPRAREVLDEVLSGGTDGLGGKDVTTILKMTETLMPERVAELRKSLVNRSDCDIETLEALFPETEGEGGLLEYARCNNSTAAWILLARRRNAKGERVGSGDALARCLDLPLDPDQALEAASLLLGRTECERACAVISKIPPEKRGVVGSFLFGEALWKLGHPEMASPLFYDVAHDAHDEKLRQNAEMRRAQCDGDLQELEGQAALSPSNRLGKALVVSSDKWKSVVAPAGIPGGSFIRVKVGAQLEEGEYHISEVSSGGGEIPMGSFSAAGIHNEIALTVESTGKLFFGVCHNGQWVTPAKN